MSKKRSNRRQFVHIGSVLDWVLTRCRPAGDADLTHIWDIWPEAVGPAISANTRPAAVKEDLLLVHVASSVWLHQLRFLEKEILAKLNRSLGSERVRQLKFKVGPL